MLIVLATSPRVAPGLLSSAAWQALRSAAVVLAPAGHPQLPALDEAGIAYRIVDAPGREADVPGREADAPGREAAGQDGTAVWLAKPGDEPVVPPGAKLLRGSADLPGAHLIDLVATMDRLRRECPWDARQTHQSLAPHLLEEPYEALDALELGDQEAFREELGDVLLQVAFHARIAAERDDGYDIDDVADGIVAKLVRRHPHVFADVPVSGADEVRRNWDDIKKQEKRDRAERAGTAGAADPPSVLDGVPFGQPALALAAQLQRRAERAGIPGDLARLAGLPGAPGAGDGDLEASDGAPEGGYGAPGAGDGAPGAGDGEPGEIGRDLFRLVARARAAGCDPETELRAAARRYRDLVRDWERS
ncbi:MAG TPA: MazG family protein [Streptosporangiaceae bacterium]|nr:MazG family protein [Streptosporangiaceae bacterium]